MAETLTHEIDTSEAAAPSRRLGALDLPKWQQRLLPLMVSMVVGLTVFFFIASFGQLAYLHWSILQTPALNINTVLNAMTLEPDAPIEDVLVVTRFRVLASLEGNALERRHHQANVLLMSRVWTRYLGFVTGMILALVGSSFILGKLREPASELEAKSSVAAVSLRSASPGILLAGLGVVLMVTTIIVHHEITVRDVPLYLQAEAIAPATLEESTAPDLDPIPPELEPADELAP